MFQLDLVQEGLARDRALDLIEEHRSNLVDVAYEIAVSLAKRDGTTNSSIVLAEMRSQGYGESLDVVDRRFMGAVFRASRGWTRVGFKNIGSHKRPVSIWKLKDG